MINPIEWLMVRYRIKCFQCGRNGNREGYFFDNVPCIIDRELRIQNWRQAQGDTPCRHCLKKVDVDYPARLEPVRQGVFA